MIHIPNTCPSCGSVLQNSGLELFCVNTELCPAQNSKRLENFCKVMKIKGLGAKSIEKLMDATMLSSIQDIYKLTEHDLVEVLGNANGKKLHTEIQKSKTQKLELFIQALGIKSIAASSAVAIAEEIKTLENLTLENINVPSLIKKLGNVKHSSLVDFVNSELYQQILKLPLNLLQPSQPTEVAGEIKGTVCITGKLNDFKNRKEAENFLSSLGWNIKSSVTKEVTHLVCEDETKTSSSSYKKATDRNIPIVTIKQLS